MHQDSFRSVVCRSLSKSLPSRSKEETVQCVAPCVVTLQPSVCQGCLGREQSWSQSYREERSMSLQRDFLMAPSLSKHFAEDLLRGAMDLQESLAMLERFQAASQSTRQPNKKRRPETSEKSLDIDTIIRGVLLRPSNAKKVLPRTVSNGLHRQLNNSTDELKNLIKHSLHKKNLLSVSSNNEQASLSQSTRYSPNDCLVSKTTQQKKVMARSFPSCTPVQTDKSTPSLVAKLMGLDRLPSQNDHSIKKDEKIKPVSSPRAFFDIEMPKSKRLLPQLSGEDSRIDTEMHVSEKVPPEHCNAGVTYTRSQNVISPSYGTPVINEIGSMKSVHREKKMEQVRAKSSKEIKVVSPTSRKQQTKEHTEINRRTKEKQKSHLNERHRDGRKDVKTKASSASRAKIVQKPDKKLPASSSSGSMKSVLQKAPSNSRRKTMTRRNVKSSTVDEIVAYQLQREIDHVMDESDGPSTEHSATPSDESVQSTDWYAESSVDDIRNDLSESNESFISTSRSGESINSADEYHQSTVRIPRKEAEMKDEITLLLLNDQSFLSRAAEMTGIGAYGHLTNQYKGTTKSEMKNRELYLDTASEQLEQKHGLRNSLCYTGFHQGSKRRATTYFSLEALLTDISNGIRKLNSYAAGDASGTTDSLHMKLERDLRCADTSINGVWDMGWEDWICMEETECFVRDAEEDILSLLIEEAALEVVT